MTHGVKLSPAQSAEVGFGFRAQGEEAGQRVYARRASGSSDRDFQYPGCVRSCEDAGRFAPRQGTQPA
jgi:hypothetical protein